MKESKENQLLQKIDALEERMRTLEKRPEQRFSFLPFWLQQLLARKDTRWLLISLVVLGTVAIGAASITKPNTFTAGEKASASKMNANFDTLYTKVNELDSKIAGKLGTYCGVTSATNGAITNQYAGAKALCETACGSTDAHVCTAHEMAIGIQLGLKPSVTAWVFSWAFGDISGGATNAHNQCSGWSSTSGEGSIYANVGAGRPSSSGCTGTPVLACCN